jgi:hypothetical protein
MSLHQNRRGWTIVFSENVRWASPKRVLDLSRFGLAVGVEFDNFATHSAFVRAAEHGREQWRVSSVNHPAHRLKIDGHLPPETDRLRDKYVRWLEKEEFRDRLGEAPLEIARALTGYRTDESEAVFVALAHSRGLLSRIASRFRPDDPPRGQTTKADISAAADP